MDAHRDATQLQASVCLTGLADKSSLWVDTYGEYRSRQWQCRMKEQASNCRQKRNCCYLEAFNELDDAGNPEQTQQLLDAQQLVYLHVTDYS